MTRPVTLITGATQGIGQAAAERLASQGHLVIGLARRQPEQPFHGEFFAVDLADPVATAETLGEITRRYDIDNVVNNAGRTTSQRLEESTLAEFQAVLDINLRAPLQCVQACLPSMLRKGRGRIVNVSSRAALGMKRRTAYSAAKSGLIGLTRTWALELASHSITVNAVAPGPIWTELFRKNNPMDEEERSALIDRIPLKRFGTPEDIAGVIAFFLSDDASFVTGQVLYACGGLSVSNAPL